MGKLRVKLYLSLHIVVWRNDVKEILDDAKVKVNPKRISGQSYPVVYRQTDGNSLYIRDNSLPLRYLQLSNLLTARDRQGRANWYTTSEMGFCYSLYKNTTTRTFEHRGEAWWVLVGAKLQIFLFCTYAVQR